MKKQSIENEIPKITNVWEAYSFARTQKRRVPELEYIIMKDSLWACEYARYIIKDRWLEAEPFIMKSPYHAYCYALNVIKGRWSEAEPYIIKDYYWANKYLRKFPEARNPSKSVPLVLGGYALMDVPNTITDEQVLKLLTLLGLSTSLSDVKEIRTYFEPIILQRLKRNMLDTINVQQIKCGYLDDLFINKQSDFT